MAMHTARDAFLAALGDLYDREHHLLDTQQHLCEHATDAGLLEALRPHITRRSRCQVSAVDGRLSAHPAPAFTGTDGPLIWLLAPRPDSARRRRRGMIGDRQKATMLWPY